MFFRSERLFLRSAFPEDAAAVLAGIGEFAIVRQLAGSPWPFREEDARRFVSRPQDPAVPHFLVTLPGEAGGPVIGAAGLFRHAEAVELGFWIASARWGRGYASEAVRALVEIAEMLGHLELAAACFADNPAAGRVLEKAGFAPTGATAARFSCARGCDAPALAWRRGAGGSGRFGQATLAAA